MFSVLIVYCGYKQRMNYKHFYSTQAISIFLITWYNYMKWDLNGNFLIQQHFFILQMLWEICPHGYFFFIKRTKKCCFTFLNERYCFCFLKPYSSNVKSFKHVPLVWYTLSDVKPTYFFMNKLKMLLCQDKQFLHIFRYVLLIYQYTFILACYTKILEGNIFQT